ncbi:hemerythrin domain-containing protein [Streptomyces sp. NPDC001153]
MCEYCGCQSLAAIDELTREHDEVVRLISHLRTAQQEGGVARMAEVAREIARVLEPHTQVEEHGLFPALAADFPDQIAALEAEHRRIDAVLSEAAGGATPSDPTWPDRLTEAMDMLRDHILKEQDGVFPAARANLGTEEWEAVEATRAKAGSTAADVPGGQGPDGRPGDRPVGHRLRPRARPGLPAGARQRGPGSGELGRGVEMVAAGHVHTIRAYGPVWGEPPLADGRAEPRGGVKRAASLGGMPGPWVRG